MTHDGTSAVFPRSVLVVSNDTYMRMSQEPKSVALLEDRIAMVLPQSAKPEFNVGLALEVRNQLEGADQLAPNALLIKSPYDQASYEFATNAIEVFASTKYHVMANVARLLGAREVRFMEANVESSETKWNAAVNAAFSAVKAGAEGSREVKQKFTARIDGQLTFPGAPPEVAKAAAYLKERNLSHDQQLRALVDLRTGENPVGSYVMKLSGTREAESNLKSALDLANAGPVKALKVGVSFSKTAQRIKDIEIVTEITF